jgi:hypothetical protein
LKPPESIKADPGTPGSLTAATPDFWPSCGYPHLAVTDGNHLQLTEAFLRHLFRRPELAPMETSCARERALHAALLEAPYRPVRDEELDALLDPDARENYQIALEFRELLMAHGTLESAYLALTGGRAGQRVPPVLMNLLVQILLRHLLAGGNPDSLELRAAELFFRPQKVSLDSGILLADAETLERRRQPGAVTVLQLLIHQAKGRVDGFQEQLEILTAANPERYWDKTEAWELVFNLNFGEPGVYALCRVLEKWLEHFHGLPARITPLRRIDDERWSWHIGLDVDSNALLNNLYRHQTLDAAESRRLLLLFRLDCDDSTRLNPSMAGRPIYLGLAMDDTNLLRLKPQNLLLNLPLTPPT